MIKLLGPPLPKFVYVACSGGVDSLAVVDFLQKKHRVYVIYIDHGTRYSTEAFRTVKDYADTRKIGIYYRLIDAKKPKTKSLEEHWRDERYRIFDDFTDPRAMSINPEAERKIITCHHLDDAVETYIWSCMHGEGKIIPYHRGYNIIRPFLLNRKSEFINWAAKTKLCHYNDPSNLDTSFTRNHIRHNVVPQIEKINPGIYKVVKKKILERYAWDSLTHG